MPGFFKKHSDFLLGFFAVLFLLFIIWYVEWGVQAFAMDIEQAFSVQNTNLAGALFNLQGAAALDLRGLVKVQP